MSRWRPTLGWVAFAGCVFVTGCEVPWSAPAGPTTTGAVRIDDAGHLEFWLGAECPDVAEIRVELTADDDESRRVLDTWIVRAEEPSGTSVERIRLGTVPGGFTEANALRTGWDEAHIVRFVVHPADTEQPSREDRRFYPDVPIRSSVPVDSVLQGTEVHGEDRWYVPDQGWFTAAEYSALGNDDDMIYPFCAVPDR